MSRVGRLYDGFVIVVCHKTLFEKDGNHN